LLKYFVRRCIGKLLSKTPLAKIIVIEIPHYDAIGESPCETPLE
jgi:hypothetical protein